MSETPKELDGFKVCEYCDGEGRASRLPWSMEVGTCGTCLGSGVLPMRGYYFVTEDPPQIKTQQLAAIQRERNEALVERSKYSTCIIAVASLLGPPNTEAYTGDDVIKWVSAMIKERDQLRAMEFQQQVAIEDLKGMADAVEVLRDIGNVVGCGHVDGPDERSQLVNCVEQTLAALTQRAEQAERERDEAIKNIDNNCRDLKHADSLLAAAEAEVKRLREGIEALRDADHYDHWAVRLSDSELAALNTLFTLLAQPSGGKEAGDEPGK